MNGKNLITALELGSSKAVAVVAEIDPLTKSPRVVGYGLCKCDAVRKGLVTDQMAANSAAHTAVEAAMKHARARGATSLLLALSGSHIEGQTNSANLAPMHANGIITAEDIHKVEELAKRRAAPAGKLIVNYARGGYRVDDRKTSTPLGLRCKRLEVSYWIAYADETYLKRAIAACNTYDTRVSELVLSSIASARAVTTHAQRASGLIVVDIGAGTTDFVVYDDGHVVDAGALPVGGHHVTSDLQVALRCTPAEAEYVKLKHGCAARTQTPKDRLVSLDNGAGPYDRKVPLQTIERVCHERIDELFGILRERLEPHLAPRAGAQGVILTGGASQLRGLPEIAREKLGTQVRLGSFTLGQMLVSSPNAADGQQRQPDLLRHSEASHELMDPIYMTVLGMLDVAATELLPTLQPEPEKGFWNNLKDLFRT